MTKIMSLFSIAVLLMNSQVLYCSQFTKEQQQKWNEQEKQLDIIDAELKQIKSFGLSLNDKLEKQNNQTKNRVKENNSKLDTSKNVNDIKRNKSVINSTYDTLITVAGRGRIEGSNIDTKNACLQFSGAGGYIKAVASSNVEIIKIDFLQQFGNNHAEIYLLSSPNTVIDVKAEGGKNNAVTVFYSGNKPHIKTEGPINVTTLEHFTFSSSISLSANARSLLYKLAIPSALFGAIYFCYWMYNKK